jgi:carbamoyltransferase
VTYVGTWPRGWLSFLKAMQSFVKDKLWIEHKIRKELQFEGSVLFTDHHYAHAASAYYASNFDESVVVTMDGVGEWDTTTIGHGKNNVLKLEKTIHFPHSLGMLYSALTYYLGFKVNSAEYKVMGLAPYGNPEPYRKHFKELVTVLDDGSFKLNMKYFGYEYGLTMTNGAFDALFDAPPRQPESPLTQREKDIAAALQECTEEIVLKIVKHATSLFGTKNVCLAGGVALNCVANGKIVAAGLCDGIYIQPAAGDAGGALGAALYVYYDMLGNAKKLNVMPTAFLGPEYSDAEIKQFLDVDSQALLGEGKTIVYRRLDDQALLSEVAHLIKGNNVIGWFQGRMEYGPRSLGNRSIIADPRNKENWQKVNLKIKFRESFRPFAPTVLEEKVGEYFALDRPSPYMLLVAPVKNGTIPAITHVDNSARIQTINRNENQRYYDLIKNFYDLTGCPVVINTSFNVRSEPIVESPKDAFNCFINTYMDYLVLGNYLISKADNLHLVDEDRLKAYLGSFSLD